MDAAIRMRKRVRFVHVHVYTCVYVYTHSHECSGHAPFTVATIKLVSSISTPLASSGQPGPGFCLVHLLLLVLGVGGSPGSL